MHIRILVDLIENMLRWDHFVLNIVLADIADWFRMGKYRNMNLLS